jgi:4-amino-4-deoxy-L-arabinose transferase-like glycosyltransferase
LKLAVGLVLLALAVRLVAAVASFGEPLAFDPKDYDRHARSIAAGNGYPGAVHERGGPSAVRPPAYPFLLGTAYKLAGQDQPPPADRDYFAASFTPDPTGPDIGRVLQALIGTVIAALIGLIAFQLWGRRAGLVALGIAAVYPPLIVLGMTLLSDPLFVMFELAAVAAALAPRAQPERRLRWALLAGALAGLAWLTRSNGWVLLLPLALLVWTGPQRSWRAPAALVAAAVIAIVPWTVRNAAAMDSFVLVSDNGGYTLAGTYNETAKSDPDFRAGWRPPQADPDYARVMATTTGELDQSRKLGREARRFALHHPLYVGEVAGCNTLRLTFLAWLACGDDRVVTRGYEGEENTSRALAWLAIAAFAIVALLAVAGWLTRARRRAPAAVWLVPVLLWTAVFVLAANRFRAPLEPFLIMLAALALLAGWDRAQRYRSSTRRGANA